jgi:hypothetical protein
MKEIKPVTMFACPVTGKLFKTAKAAAKSAEAEQKAIDATKELERLAAISKETAKKNADYIRLNLADVKDLPRMLIEKAQEFYGIKLSNLVIDVGFGDVSCSHGAPIGKQTNWSGRDKNLPTSFLGWSGQIKAKAERAGSKKNGGFENSINDNLFGNYGIGFKGFHTSSGCGGSFGQYDMDIGFYFFLEDFPLLAEKHEVFVKEKAKFMQNKQNIASASTNAGNFVAKHVSITDLNTEIQKLEQKRNALAGSLFQEYQKANPAIVEPQLPEWDFLKTQFGSRWGNSWLYDND